MGNRAYFWIFISMVGLAGCSESLAQTSGSSGFPVVNLDPSKGQEVGFAFEAFLSPHQEPGEEADTPAVIPPDFRSTTPSVARKDRASRGHGMVRFTRDLSQAQVDVAISGIEPSSINMFHIHCGKPDQLGPIMMDFGPFVDFAEVFADGRMTFTIDFTHIEATRTSGHGAAEGFLAGCPIVQGIDDDHKTVSGMKYVADQGDLYFNLHTTGQTYFGDIRGRLHAVDLATNTAQGGGQ